MTIHLATREHLAHPSNLCLRALAFALAIGASSCRPAEPAKDVGIKATASATLAEEVGRANDQLYAALNAMFTGDLTPLGEAWSHSSEVTNTAPFGGRQTGWDAVRGEFEREARMKLGGRIVCEDRLIRATEDMGYVLCVEVGENMTEDGKPIAVRHRATNIFRREGGRFQLAHHHTDLSPSLHE
jgi:ketosteroid isomerase-like protein